MTTGGIVAWLPWRVSCKITEEPGVGLGIWLGSILEGPAMGAPNSLWKVKWVWLISLPKYV